METTTKSTDAPVRRAWTQDVVVKVAVLRNRVREVRACSPGHTTGAPDAARVEVVCAGVDALLNAAERAARWKDPQPSRWANWWRGTLVEAAYENLHAAEAELASVYPDEEVDAEVPEAVARVAAGVHRNDPRRTAVGALVRMEPGPRKRAALRRAIAIGYEVVDRRHAQVRSFRNIVLLMSAFVFVLMAAVGAVLTLAPGAVPLCFDPVGGPRVCPSGGDVASSLDIWVVMLLGLLGGALAAAVSIRNIRGTSTPYDVPVALALLKVPFGAATAVAALVFIRGDFVPGLSALDSQEQILAYALVFGYAQQLLTQLIDTRAQRVLDSVPSKDAATASAELPPAAWVGEEPRELRDPTLDVDAARVPLPRSRRPVRKAPAVSLADGAGADHRSDSSGR